MKRTNTTKIQILFLFLKVEANFDTKCTRYRPFVKKCTYRKVIWRCNSKFINKKHCGTPSLDTDTIQAMFINVYNQLMRNQKQVFADCEIMRRALMDFESLDTEVARHIEETEVIAELVKLSIKENSSSVQSQEVYLNKYESLTNRYQTAVDEFEWLKTERTRRQQQDKAISTFIRTLKRNPLVLDKWDDTIWSVIVEKGVVHCNRRITFVFYNGAEIEVGAE